MFCRAFIISSVFVLALDIFIALFIKFCGKSSVVLITTPASIIIHKLLPFINKGNVITGAIMILLPGVPLTNGIKDIIYGDFESGMAKFGEAMLIITAVGAGIGAALSIGVGVKI